jgi:hypothetical protein
MMRGLAKLPTESELAQAYQELLGLRALSEAGASDRVPEEAQWALWSQWARLDPRFAELLTQRLAKDWAEIHPLKLNQELKRQPWPAVFGVLIEQASEFLVAKPRRSVFRSWAQCVMNEIDPAPGELFFVGLRKLAGKEMRLDATLALTLYRKWGYLGRELLVNKSARFKGTLLPPEAREAALSELIKARRRFSTRDYIDHLGGLVSVRQAEMDLAARAARKELKREGRTKARRWVAR